MPTSCLCSTSTPNILFTLVSTARICAKDTSPNRSMTGSTAATGAQKRERFIKAHDAVNNFVRLAGNRCTLSIADDACGHGHAVSYRPVMDRVRLISAHYASPRGRHSSTLVPKQPLFRFARDRGQS